MSCTHPNPDRRVIDLILAMRPGRPAALRDPATCGCHPRPMAVAPDRWYLCDYHDGMSDALDIFIDTAPPAAVSPVAPVESTPPTPGATTNAGGGG